MANALFIVTIATAIGLQPCQRPLDLAGYLQADGAITVRAYGNFVDPYFPTKALLVAHGAGMDVRASALAWIAWLRPRQLADGRFERYCGTAGRWEACGEEDADDAMLALWMQLLYAMAPPDRFPGEWISTVTAAESYLDTVRDPTTGVYYISRSKPTGLFMDNIEVYAALRESAKARRRYGDIAHAARYTQAAETLAQAIDRVFYRPDRGEYAASTHARPDRSFYPDAVAQTYPWLIGFPLDRSSDRDAFRNWLRMYRAAWESPELDYPWGLVAMTAARVGDEGTAKNWVRKAASARGTKRWNVLEEAVYQALAGDCGTARK